jgi:ESCRT-I complex subunit TSG101
MAHLNTQNQQVAAVDAILYKLRCYKNSQRVRSDVLDALRNYPSLQPRSGNLAKQNVQTTLLYLAGTVPIFYNGVQYNIPVNIWIVDSFPYAPPMCYVTPTPDMVIKPKHRHVDSAGMCYLPYLSSWNPNNCNLTTLISTMSQVFGQDPPVRSNAVQPPKQEPQPTRQPIPQTLNPYVNPTPPSSTYGNAFNSNPYVSPLPQNNPYPYQAPNSQSAYQTPTPNPYPTHNQSQTPYQTPNQTPNFSNPLPQYGTQNSSTPYEDPATVAKRNAIRSATERLQTKMQEFFSSTTKNIDNLIAENGRLEDKQRNLDIEKQHLDTQYIQLTTDIGGLTKF